MQKGEAPTLIFNETIKTYKPLYFLNFFIYLSLIIYLSFYLSNGETVKPQLRSNIPQFHTLRQ